MSDNTQKRYGPVEWSSSVLDSAHNFRSVNDDAPVTEEMVRGWSTYFTSEAVNFRRSHEAIISMLR